jgi:hypothetical protein
MIIENSEVILSIAYFPPIQYFSKLIVYDSVIIEQFENYTKQSFRNRCEILSPSGIQTLSIPVEKISGSKQQIKDVKIDYSKHWQSNHFKSIQTAYFSSPFYEFYIDALKGFFERKYIFLFDFNIEIIQTLLNEMQIEKPLKYSEYFQNNYHFSDFRNKIHPKINISEDSQFKPVRYIQVFFDTFEFLPNLSIIDLLFNEGPYTPQILKMTNELK